MPVIDAQVHVYEANTPARPWHKVPNWPSHVTADEMVAAMDAVGVDGAIDVSPFFLYRYDASYALQVQRAHPGRFALVRPVDPDDPAAAEVVADWKRTPGAVALRILMDKGAGRGAAHRGLARIAAAAGRHDMPVNLHCWENVEEAMALVDRHPGTRFVIDHLGMVQPLARTAPPGNWNELPKVLELARRPNAAIKVTGACTMSRRPFPYEDIWDPLARVFDAWGFERCLWGSDWTRSAELVSYGEAVEAFRVSDRLTEAERAMLMGGACANVYGWKPAGRAPPA